MKNKPTQIAIIVSDLHCGSVVGLAPPKTTTEHGNEVSFGENHHQAWLWGMWKEAISIAKSIVGGSNAALIVNGDATEGVHHRNESEIIAAAIETHVKMARECLKPLHDICKKTFIVKGTECHTKEMENLLAKKLKAETGAAKDKWLIKVNGCLIDVAHHMTTSGRAYLEASAMSILMGNARINYVRSNQEVPKVFIRAHRHCGGHYTDGQGMFVVTGAWQMLTRHGHKVVTDSIPRPSISILDWRGKPHGTLPIVHEIFFNPPPHEQAII